MEKYIIVIASTSLAMSVIIVALTLFNRYFSTGYPAKWRYYTWLVVLSGLLLPFRPDVKLPFEPVRLPGIFTGSADSVSSGAAAFTGSTGNDGEQRQSIINSPSDSGDKDKPVKSNYDIVQVSATARGGTDVEPGRNAASGEPEANHEETSGTSDISGISAISTASVVFIIWLAGMLFTIAFYLWHHKRFSATVRRWKSEVTEDKILSALERTKSEMGIKGKIEIYKCKSVISPMLTGFFKPVILLPDRDIHKDDLAFILKHELIHYKRKDLWINLLVIFTKAVHWFNPVVYIMAAEIRRDCEISCDEAVIGGASLETRRLYGEAIIGFIGVNNAVKNALSHNLYGGKNTMKKRIMSIMDTGRKKKKAAFLCLALVFTATFLSGFIFVSGSVPANPEDKALEAVLKETGGGTIVKCELDYLGDKNTGIEVYEVEVINGDTKYDVEIGVEDLVIYSYEEEKKNKNLSAVIPVDTDITAEEAIEKALAKTGGGEAIKWELEVKRGVKVYEIEIADAQTKYTMYVGAADGAITNYKERAITSSKSNNTGKTNTSNTSTSNSSNSSNSSTGKSTSTATSTAKPTLISLSEAKEIAIAEVGGGSVKDSELDHEKGKWIYEIEVMSGRTEYEVEINAETGEIIKVEIDD